MPDDLVKPKVGGVSQRMMTFRVADAKREDVAETRTVEISVSSEEPVERWFGNEVLDHSEKSVDLSFMSGGSAPLLLNHDRRQQVGVIERAWIEKKRMKATIRFGRSATAEEILNDVMDGIRSNISVGYRIDEVHEDKKTDTVTVTNWYPYEASIVAIPADVTVGVGRAAYAKARKDNDMPDPVVDNNSNVDGAVQTPAPPAQNRQQPAPLPGTPDDVQYSARNVMSDNGPRAVQFSEAQLTERMTERANEVVEIYALGAAHNIDRAETDKFVREGKSLTEFAGYVRASIDPDKPLRNDEIGMTKKEARQFSIFRLARAYDDNATKAVRDAAAFEIEAVAAAMDADVSGVEAKGVRMPREVLSDWIIPGTYMHAQLARSRDERMYHQERTLNTSDDSSLVPQDYRAGSFIDVLRNIMGPMNAGATVLGGLSGNLDIPKKLTASAAAWLSAEGDNASASEATYGLVSLRPKDLAVYTDITRRMRQQASPDIENLTRMDILMAMALGADLAALEGTGTGGQPEGVLNVTGIGKPTAFAGVNPTFAEVVALETAVADDNALFGNLAYIGRTNMRGALKTTTKDAGSGQFVMGSGDELNGYRYVPSNQGTDGNLYFGNWSDLLIGMWGTLDLNFDRAALALSDGLRIIAFQTMDMAVRHAQSFAYNNDT